MATKIFETRDRDESHKKLEEVLHNGTHPRAECREADERGFYSVWDGPQRDGDATESSTDALDTSTLTDAQLAKLADLIAARMKGG